MFFYLASVVPAIWFLELNEMELRIENKKIRMNETLAAYRSGNETLIKEIANTVPGLKVCQSINQSINARFVGRRYTTRPGAPAIVQL